MRQEQDKDTEPSSPSATGSSLSRGAVTVPGTPGAFSPTALEPGPTPDGAEGAQEGTEDEHRTQEPLGKAWKRKAGSSQDMRGSAARSARSRGSSGAFAAVLALGFVCFLSLQTYLDIEAETEGTLEKEGHIPAPSF